MSQVITSYDKEENKTPSGVNESTNLANKTHRAQVKFEFHLNNE